MNEFSRRLKKNDTVDLYFVDEQEDDREFKNFSKVVFFKFSPKRWNGNNWKAKLYKDTIELWNLYKLHKKIAGIIDSRKYDIVLLEPSRFTQAPFLLRFLKTRKIYYCQEPLRMVYDPALGVPKGLKPHKFIYENLNRYVRKIIDLENIKHADYVLTNSKYTRAKVNEAYGIDGKVCYMGVDTDIFKPIKIKKDIDILFIGSYAQDDGYNMLKNIQYKLGKDVKFKILASEKQWITNDYEIRKLYCRSKIALSLAHNEPFGLIPIESMACGVPVIAVDEGGYKESVIDKKTGFLLDRNVHIFVSCLKELLDDKKKLQELGRSARNVMVRDWTWERSTKELRKVLKQAVRMV